jgi:putative transcriptional regulator
MKRNLFNELIDGFKDLADHREGKITLRTHTVEYMPPLKINSKELTKLRKRLNVSRAVFASYLRTNVRTLENWEQGRAHPNAQAALLVRLVEKYPDVWTKLRNL